MLKDSYESVRKLAAGVQDMDRLYALSKDLNLISAKLELYYRAWTRLYDSTRPERRKEIAA